MLMGHQPGVKGKMRGFHGSVAMIYTDDDGFAHLASPPRLRFFFWQLTGKSAYDHTDWNKYEFLLAELEQDIVYRGGIEFPREGAELKQFLPRLCAWQTYPDHRSLSPPGSIPRMCLC